MRFGIREMMLTGILLSVPLSSYWLVFRPQNREIARAKSEIRHKDEMLAKLREETARNADLKKANEDISRSVASIEARLPSGKEIDAVVRQVSDLAVQSGLAAPAMKSAKPLKAALYMEQPLEMQMEGNFHGFYEFLLKLEQLPRITRIPDMKIKRDEQENGNLKAEFTLSIYFQDDVGSPKP
ncbi:MAG: type 4a pilus biogenesis protein PilO [Phycisphaerales bacterium]|nr:type 4a pilus biogenesis protein PilO [Phycisphaerales bacterium]